MSAPILAPVKSAPLRSNPLRRAMMRAPANLAPLKIGASAEEVSRPDETTRPKRLAFDRFASVKRARITQARSSLAPARSAPVKGFRMPASHGARGCTEAGVRKASKEETAGGVCACGSVGLWGFKARFCATWPLSDGTAGLNGERGR